MASNGDFETKSPVESPAGNRGLFTDWQSIETAPRDGTAILGYSTEGVMYVCWHHADGWVFFQNHKGDRWYFHPTDWKPLDPPPAKRPGKKPESAEPTRRDDWHYDSQGYCDNPGRGY